MNLSESQLRSVILPAGQDRLLFVRLISKVYSLFHLSFHQWQAYDEPDTMGMLCG